MSDQEQAKRAVGGADLPNGEKASASSLGLLGRCARAWWFEKIDGRELVFSPKQLESFARGTALHEAIEAYFKAPEVDTSGDPLVDQALPFLTKLKYRKTLVSEGYMEFEREGIMLRGFIDVSTDKGILDFKTTSNIWKWGEKDRTIGKNLQLNLYAYHWFTELYPDATKCTVAHLQFQTKGKAEVGFVSASRSKLNVLDFMLDEVDPLLRLQSSIRDAKSQEDVEFNHGGCGAYGGCPHKEYCTAYRGK